jgi:hypothetical protein
MSIFTHTTGNEVSDVMLDVVHDWHAAGRSGDLVETLSGCMAPQEDDSLWLNQCIFDLTVEELLGASGSFIIEVKDGRVFFYNIEAHTDAADELSNDEFFTKWYDPNNTSPLKTRIEISEKLPGCFLLTPRQYLNHDFSAMAEAIASDFLIYSGVDITSGKYKCWAWLTCSLNSRQMELIDLDDLSREEIVDMCNRGKVIQIKI